MTPRMAEGDRGSDRRRVSAMACLGFGCFLLDQTVGGEGAEEGRVWPLGHKYQMMLNWVGWTAVGRVPLDCVVALQTQRISGERRTVDGLFWDQTIGHNQLRKLGLGRMFRLAFIPQDHFPCAGLGAGPRSGEGWPDSEPAWLLVSD